MQWTKQHVNKQWTDMEENHVAEHGSRYPPNLANNGFVEVIIRYFFRRRVKDEPFSTSSESSSEDHRSLKNSSEVKNLVYKVTGIVQNGNVSEDGWKNEAFSRSSGWTAVCVVSTADCFNDRNVYRRQYSKPVTTSFSISPFWSGGTTVRWKLGLDFHWLILPAFSVIRIGRRYPEEMCIDSARQMLSYSSASQDKTKTSNDIYPSLGQHK